jgi:phosphoglycerol transferase MdoB-like AlkP superfamily enzyme
MLRPFRDALLLAIFWIICFDVHRVLFSVHHWGKLKSVGTWEWLQAFLYSFRLDLGTACALSAAPFIFRLVEYYSGKRWSYRLFRTVLTFFLVVLVLVQAGELVAYGEWNHKLSTRVFMHLSHPDEVTRTASAGMTLWYLFYASVQFAVGLLISKKLFRPVDKPLRPGRTKTAWQFPFQLFVPLALMFLLLRGGLQPIPLNIASASYTDKAIANDISINSLYYFGNAFLRYNRSDIDEYMPKVNKALALATVKEWYAYPKEHDRYFLTKTRPNVVVIVLEGWAAEAISTLGPEKGSTPNFDRVAADGLLFTNIYSTGTTSEIGNSSIFSGNPAVPEVSISMQPEKHRKLHSLNEDFESWGYHTGYMFSGDLKYGNIGGYFMDHGFDVVKDENDFPGDLPRGKLNFFDRDLYRFLIKEINTGKKPFFQCAFTGSTHSPYDQPKGKGKRFKGNEADYMNSLVYADECLGEFLKKCSRQPWYANTLFVFVADHGHASPTVLDSGSGKFYRIPLLFYGNVIKPEYRGRRMDVIGSQADIASTLITQFRGDPSRYPWSKDLMNPNVPQFAFHAILKGYGWQSPGGNLTYSMELKRKVEDTYPKGKSAAELRNCNFFLTAIYDDYKKL